MRFCTLVIVGLVGIASWTATAANAKAQEALTPFAAASGVSFQDAPAAPELRLNRFRLELSRAEEERSFAFTPHQAQRRNGPNYAFALVTRAGAGFDLALSQRGGIGFNAAGDVARHSRSAELRIGRGLGMREDAPSAGPRWYFFAASEDEALIWRPGQRTAFGAEPGGFAMQDRVEIGDLQAGITYEFRGVQASLAYVEREVTVRSGAQHFSEDERFAGFTLTMRH